MAVAIQPAMPPRPVSDTPITIATARPQAKRRMSGKENLPQGKPTSASGLSNVRARRERPCDACRRRKSRCVINEGAVLCVLCEFHKQECTFVQDPQPRKRKVTGDADKQKEGGSPKKRYALHYFSVTPTPGCAYHFRMFCITKTKSRHVLVILIARIDLSIQQ